MKPEIKKLLILNLPYLLFVWLFDKAGAAVRLSPGADASAKLLHLGDGFTAAFSSIAPSFHPADLSSTSWLILLPISSATEGPTPDTGGNSPPVKALSESFVRYSDPCSVSYTPQNSKLLSQEMLLSCAGDIRYR